MISGQHHWASSSYLHQYANHAALLEDDRRNSNGRFAVEVVGNAMTLPVSQNWKGYWQRKTARVLQKTIFRYVVNKQL